ncbi:hypothetical protein ACS0TY_000390 [Phlomoides rotata]
MLPPSRSVQPFPRTSQVFKEVAIIRHPRIGEYAFGFITSTIILRKSSGAEELCCVYERGAKQERRLTEEPLQQQLEEKRARVPKAHPYPYTIDYPVVCISYIS